MHRNTLVFGSALILLGALLLLNSLGILSVNAWNIFWAAIFILFGVTLLWGALRGSGQISGETASLLLDGAQQARVHFQHGAGRLLVGAGANPDELYSGTFGGGLEQQTSRNGNQLNTRLKVPRSGIPMIIFPWSWWQDRIDWDVRLNPDIPLDLEFGVGAGEYRLDLSQLQVTRLNLQTGASSTELTVPAQVAQSQIRVNAGAADVKIRIPQGVAARVRVTGGLMGASVDRNRFPRSGKVYQSPDYESAPYRAEIFVEMGAGSVTVS